MRKIATILTLVLFLGMLPKSVSQTLGIKAGMNLSTMTIKGSELAVPYTLNRNITPKMNILFSVGATAEFPIMKHFDLQTGLSLSGLGYRDSFQEVFRTSTLYTKEAHNLFYASIPALVKVPFSLGKITLYGVAGPYVALGIFGKNKSSSTFSDSLSETQTTNVKWGTDPAISDFKRLDYGIEGGVGVMYSKFQVGITYDFGLANISPNSENMVEFHNRVIGISFNYLFGGNKRKTEDRSREQNLLTRNLPSDNLEKTNPDVKMSDALKAEEQKIITTEAERRRIDKARTDSINAINAEKIRAELLKARADSVSAVLAARRANENRRLDKIKADSLKLAQNEVVYRIQFASTTIKKGSYKISVGDKSLSTWEYFYNGAYRSTVGEFKTLSEASEFQKKVKQSGYLQAFVVAFKNNIRTTDPSLFK